MNEPIASYLWINVGIGSGIAADAMLATITRARTLNSVKEAVKWASAIGLTHWLFPMVGFVGGWYLASHGVARALVYGLGGGVLILYVLQVLRERSRIDRDSDVQLSRVSFWLAVWGVSIDALVTGPGKAAATAHWTGTQVAISFPLVGIVVFVLVLASTAPAMTLHKRLVSARDRSWRGLAVFFNVATWVEILVFTWFSMLSFVEALGAMRVIRPSYSIVSVCAFVLGLLFVSVLAAKVWRAQSIAAQRLVQS